MAVLTIYGNKIEFDFLSITNWKTQSGDPFAFPVEIGGEQCFVKKFKQYPPRSQDLLAHFDDRETIGIPTVFEYQKGEEFGEPVYYLVLKMVPGIVFENVFYQEHHIVKLGQFVKQIFWGFKEIHSMNYWHCDFCFKNLMADIAERQYTLIDIDSCLPNEKKPNINRAINLDLISGVGLIFEEIGYIFDWMDVISGKQYNYLQLSMALFHLAHCNLDSSLNAKPKSINKTATIFLKNNFYVINFLLNGIINGFKESDFISVIPYINSYNDRLGTTRSTQIDKQLLNKVVSLGLLKKINTEPEPKPKPKPKDILERPFFHQFQVNGKYKILNVNKEDVVTLSWIVENATEIRYDDRLLGRKKKGKASIKITEPIDLEIEAVNQLNGQFVVTKSPKILIRLNKEETIAQPYIDIWVDGKKIDADKSNLVCEGIVDVKWKVSNAKEFYFNNSKELLNGSKKIKIFKERINLKLRAVNFNQAGNNKQILKRSINLHYFLKEPVINFVEINGKRNNQYTFDEDEKVIIHWNTKNANQIFLNDELISNQPIGLYELKVQNPVILRLKAVNKSENHNQNKFVQHSPLKINIRTKFIEPSASEPSINVLTFNGTSVINCDEYNIGNNKNINVFVQTKEADSICIKKSHNSSSNETEIFYSNQATHTFSLDELYNNVVIIEVKGTANGMSPRRVTKEIAIIKDYPELKIDKLEINSQNVLVNPTYEYQKGESIRLSLNILNAEQITLNNEIVKHSTTLNITQPKNKESNILYLEIFYLDKKGNTQSIKKQISLQQIKSKSNTWFWWIIGIIILLLLMLN